MPARAIRDYEIKIRNALRKLEETINAQLEFVSIF